MKKQLFALVAMLLATASVSACSFPIASLDQQVGEAEEIFIANLLEAKVIPVDEHHQWPWIEGRFQVKKILKGGVQPEEVILTTGLGRSDCGVGMMVSWNYVIFKGRGDTVIAGPSGTHVIEDFQMVEVADKIASIVRQRPHKSPLK